MSTCPRPAQTCCVSLCRASSTRCSRPMPTVCGAAYAARDEARTTRRNGYRRRDLDTRVGTLGVAAPKLCGSYLPEWLLERRRRAEGGAHLGGGAQLPAEGLHPPDGPAGAVPGDHRPVPVEVSVMAHDLDELVRDFRERPLGAGSTRARCMNGWDTSRSRRRSATCTSSDALPTMPASIGSLSRTARRPSIEQAHRSSSASP